jgi:hypothetical protein
VSDEHVGIYRFAFFMDMLALGVRWVLDHKQTIALSRRRLNVCS